MKPKKFRKAAAILLTAAILAADFGGAGNLVYASQAEITTEKNSGTENTGEEVEPEKNIQSPEENQNSEKDTQVPGDNIQDPEDAQVPGDDSQNSGGSTQNPEDNSQNPGDDTQSPGNDPLNPGDEAQNPEDIREPEDGSWNPEEEPDAQNEKKDVQDKKEISGEEAEELLTEEETELSPEEAFAELIKEYDMYGTLTNGVEFLIRQEASRDAAVVQTLTSGYQIKLTGVVLTETGVWFQIEFAVNGRIYTGYIQSDYVVSQDERLSEWRDQHVSKQRQLSSVNASGKTDLNAFPKSYRSGIEKMIKAHPNWTFVPMNTGLEWSDVLKNEMGDAVNLVENYRPSTWKSTASNAYNMQTGEWVIKNGTTWVQASESLIKYYLDPRNFLNDEAVFQFEQLTYNKSHHKESGVEKVLKNTFMSSKKLEDGSEGGITYAQAFMKIGKELKVSPYFLASRVRQEQGVNGTSALISGKYPGYEGYYNYFNMGATGIGNDVITSGLTEAKNAGWNTRYKALKGGAEKVSSKYIKRGQDTFYLQKFDVDASYDGLYWHQYMQNLQAAESEGKSVYRSYSEMGALNNSFVFKVPVFNNMPSSPGAKPKEDGTLSKPSLKAASIGTTENKLTWNEVAGSVGYQVYRAEGENGKYTRIKTLNGLGQTSYVDKNVVPGKRYYYKVRAFLKLKEGNLYSSYSAEKMIDGTVPDISWNKLSIKNYKTVELSWKQAAVDGYKIYRKTGSGSYTCIKTVTGKSNLTFQDTTVVPGNTYTYRIRGYRRVDGKDYYSAYTGTKTAQIKMAKPALTKGSVSGGSKIKLTWKRDSKADGYDIVRATSKKGKYTVIKSISGNKTVSWSDNTIVSGKTYYYKVRSYVRSSAGTKRSSYSGILEVKTKLAKGKITSISVSSGKIKLKWKKESKATGYKIYRATSKKGKYKEVKKITKNSSLSWTDKNVTAGKTYYYKVRSYAANRDKTRYSSYSPVVSAKAKLAGTKLTKASNGGSGKVTLKWQEQKAADGYKIYRKTGKNGKYKEIKTISKSEKVSFTNSKLKKDTTYYYKIRAYKKINGSIKYSAYSAEKSVKVKK